MVSVAAAATPADPDASPQTRHVLDYLANLPGNGSSNRIVVGQFGVSSDPTDYQGVHSVTGKWVGMYSGDYVWEYPPRPTITPAIMAQAIASVNGKAVSYFNEGGLVSISYHFMNPAVPDGSPMDATAVDMGQLITSGTALNTTFKGYLDGLAGGLAQLQSEKVVVLLRFFHEMNEGFFWWGRNGTPAEYTRVWKYIFNYLTRTKGLHNLLFVWAPYESIDITRYPGSGYVDIVGVDLYGSASPDTPAGYDYLRHLRKPFAITEIGACAGGLTFAYGKCPPQDIGGILTSIKKNMPAAVYVLFWDGVYSLRYNVGASAILDDPWVVNRDKVPALTSTPLAH